MRRLNKISLPVFIHFFLWTVFFTTLWGRTIFHGRDGSLLAGNFTGVWGDWAMHFTFGSTMAYRALFPLKSPLLTAAPFYYPFAADLLSALLVRAGAPFFPAFVVPSFLFTLLMLFALFYFYKEVFGSEKTAALSSCVFLLNGGLGFVFFLKGVLQSAARLQAFADPPLNYRDHHIFFEPLTEMIFSQRSFPLGFALAGLALAWLHSALRLKPESRRGKLKLVAAGLVIAVLPVVHTHSFLAVSIISAFWLLGDLLENGARRLPSRLAPALAAALPGLPIFYEFIFTRVPAAKFFRWYPGWYAHDAPIGWLGFWLRNWSITPVMAVLGLALALRRGAQSGTRTLFIFLPFFAIFLLVNLFAFAPWIWDNQKLLVWASLGLSGLAASAAVEIASRKAGLVRGKAWAAALFLLMTASGLLDVYRLLVCQSASNVLYTPEELQLADWAKSGTPVGSTWLTSDRHNHWLYNLTGRQAVMAYGGWLWSMGLDDAAVRKDVREMFLHPQDASSFKKYGVDYVVVGPDEKATWRADPVLFDKYFLPIKRTWNYTIYAAPGGRSP